MKAFFAAPQFFPPLRFFYGLVNSNVWVVLDHQPFETYQGHCRIKTESGIQILRAPVKLPCSKPVYEMVVNNYRPWKRAFLKAIERSYGETEYFDIYDDGLKYFIEGPCVMLETLNIQTTLWIAGLLKKHPTVVNSRNLYSSEAKKEEVVETLSGKLAATPFNGSFKHPRYKQIGGTFEQNLSILDPLFCIGAAETRKLLIDG